MRNISDYILEAKLQDTPKELEEMKHYTYDILSSGRKKQSVWNRGEVLWSSNGPVVNCQTSRSDCFLKIGEEVPADVVSRFGIAEINGSKGNGDYPTIIYFQDSQITDFEGVFTPGCKITGDVKFFIQRCEKLKSFKGLPQSGQYRIYAEDCPGLRNFEGVAPDVKEIKLWDCENVSSFKGLPPQAPNLFLEFGGKVGIKNLKNIPSTLRHINWSDKMEYIPSFEEIQNATQAVGTTYKKYMIDWNDWEYWMKHHRRKKK